MKILHENNVPSAKKKKTPSAAGSGQLGSAVLF